MEGKRGIRFVLGTIVKLLVYLVICAAAAYVCGRFSPEDTVFVAVPLSAAIINWVCLTYIEMGKRSFLSKGYLLENIFIGAIVGLIVILAAAGVEWVFGKLSMNGFYSDYDVRETIHEVCLHELLAGIVIFGYFYHIIKQDFGMILAVIAASLLYALFVMYDKYDGIQTVISSVSSPSQMVTIFNIILIGVAAALIQIYLGDVRSSCSFLCLFGFGDRLIWQLCISRYNGAVISDTGVLYDSIIFTAVILLACVTILFSFKNRDF